jgi:hypothetical protein
MKDIDPNDSTKPDFLLRKDKPRSLEEALAIIEAETLCQHDSKRDPNQETLWNLPKIEHRKPLQEEELYDQSNIINTFLSKEPSKIIKGTELGMVFKELLEYFLRNEDIFRFKLTHHKAGISQEGYPIIFFTATRQNEQGEEVKYFISERISISTPTEFKQAKMLCIAQAFLEARVCRITQENGGIR